MYNNKQQKKEGKKGGKKKRERERERERGGGAAAAEEDRNRSEAQKYFEIMGKEGTETFNVKTSVAHHEQIGLQHFIAR